MNLASLGIDIAPQVAKEVATVQAKIMVAMRFPRNEKVAIEKALECCEDYNFADDCLYVLNFGKEPVKGLTVRMAELLGCLWKNLDIVQTVTMNDEKNLGFNMAITDLESNFTFSSSIIIEKTITRSYVKKGEDIIDEWLNSKGYKVYKVKATEDEVLKKLNIWKSKEKRNAILNLIPVNYRRQILEKIIDTMGLEIKKNKKEFLEKLLLAFENEGINKEGVEGLIGKKISKLSEENIITLRCIFKHIKKRNDLESAERKGKEAANTFTEKPTTTVSGKSDSPADELPDYVSVAKSRYQGLFKEEKVKVLNILFPGKNTTKIAFTKSTTKERCKEVNQAINSLSLPTSEKKDPEPSNDEDSGSKEPEKQPADNKTASELTPSQGLAKKKFDVLSGPDKLTVTRAVWGGRTNIPDIEDWSIQNDANCAKICNAIKDLSTKEVPNNSGTDLEIMKEAFFNLAEPAQGYILGLYEIKTADFDSFDARFIKTIMEDIMKVAK